MVTDNLYSKSSEMQVLSALFIDNNSFTEIVDFLEPDDFYFSSHKLIYDAMKKLYSSDEPITPITLFEKLKNAAKEIGGVTYLSQIAASGTSSKNIRNYGLIVKEKASNRRLLKDLKIAAQQIEKNVKNYDGIIEDMQNSFNEISPTSKKVESMEVILQRYLDLLEKKGKGEIESLTLKTGLKNLDKFIGGLEKQNLVVLAARPSMGKSLVSLSMALNMALKSKLKVAFFHLEMGEAPSVERILSNKALIPMNRLKEGSIQDEEWIKIISCCNELCKADFHMFNELYTLKSIVSQCKRLKYQKGLDVVFIDYLQLIETDKTNDNRNLDVSFISRSLKLLAKELNITIIALSQLSRAPEARINHRPMLADLRESGAIEQDADLVMFLYRDEYYHADSQDQGTIELIIGKHRNGSVGTVKMKWSGEYQQVI